MFAFFSCLGSGCVVLSFALSTRPSYWVDFDFERGEWCVKHQTFQSPSQQHQPAVVVVVLCWCWIPNAEKQHIGGDEVEVRRTVNH
uniref:Putative secreted protein n=1 Tax=Anopheles darlingi TaxID=43151 RepID=A0A2M4DRM9_ANODA